MSERAGHAIHWQRHGNGAREALFIHGALAHSGIWRDIVPGLPVTATTFDLPGHGRSADWHGSDYHGTCTEIARSFCAGPTDLIGHSFGATLALRLAVEQPELCRTLTLIEPVFFAAPRADSAPEIAEHDTVFARVFTALKAKDHDAAARLFTEVWGDGRPWAELPEVQRAKMAARMPLIAAGISAHDHDGAGLLAPGRMERLTMPVSLIRGDCSPPVIAAAHRALMARIPGASDQVIAGAGHMVPLTHPGAVRAAVLTAVR